MPTAPDTSYRASFHLAAAACALHRMYLWNLNPSSLRSGVHASHAPSGVKGLDASQQTSTDSKRDQTTTPGFHFARGLFADRL